MSAILVLASLVAIVVAFLLGVFVGAWLTDGLPGARP